MAKPILLDLTMEELMTLPALQGQPSFRVKQLYGWLTKGATFEEMKNLPKSLREALKETTLLMPVEIHEAFASKKDSTVKFLFALHDGHIVEGVLMQYHYGYTLCISTQVGCKMGCAFCASTLDGCVRHLSSGEMIAQVIAANRYLLDQGIDAKIGHVVLMGSGEPMDNYDNTVAFLRKINEEQGLHISLRNISVSTCGLVPQIERFSKEGLPVTLSISLHAPTDDIRREIMPVANTYPITQLMQTVRAYVKQTGRRVVFEYALIDQTNSKPEHARKLAQLVSGLQCHVNLIPLNHVGESGLMPATPKAVQTFLQTLESLHVSATIRREMGSDIAGACGQLRRRHLQSTT